MQPRDGDALASACCNWEARCSSRSNSRSIDFLPSSIVVNTLASPGDIPDLSAIGNGCAVVLTAGACGDALELQMQLKERFVTHIAAVASCEICELFLEGEYVGSARGQDHQWLQLSSGGDADAAANRHQDSSAMRLFLFDCTDGAKSSSKIMLRLRRSISALAPDISLGVVAVYCNIHAPRLPPPVMDVDKVRALLSQLQQSSSPTPGASPPTIIVHPQAHHLLEHMQASMRSAIGKHAACDFMSAPSVPSAQSSSSLAASSSSSNAPALAASSSSSNAPALAASSSLSNAPALTSESPSDSCSSAKEPAPYDGPSHDPSPHHHALNSMIQSAVRTALREEAAAAVALAASTLSRDLHTAIKTAVREAIREEIEPIVSSVTASTAAATALAVQQLGDRVATAVEAAAQLLRASIVDAAVGARGR